jgi:tyrosyl-tRNA synthetase
MRFSSPILNDLERRGFLYQITDPQALDEIFCCGEEVVFYIGFDPTAKSLHVGHLLWIRLIRKLQAAGAHPIVLVGGATSKIGDPTWKDKERVMLDYATVVENVRTITEKLRRLVKFDGCENSALLLNNDDWLSKLNYLEFLRDFGSLFSVNKMLTMDSVSRRLERQQHLSFLEFNYMLLQAYDFLYLFENHNCKVQIGGADQWSNMISGVDLIRRKTGQIAVGMSMPLLTNAEGKKMGKTEKGAVWMDEQLMSPFDFWQYWRNVDDRDVTKLMKLFTDLEVDEIERYEALVGHKEMNEAKIKLADEITTFVHPYVNLEAIHKTAAGLFGGTGEVDNVETFEIPTGTRIDKALVLTGLASSQTAARRLIDGQGVKIDGQTVKVYDALLEGEHIVSVGKKKFVRIKA